MQVVIVGTGLIGGSIAKDLRASGRIQSIIGVDSNVVHARAAHRLKLVDTILPLGKALKQADVVFLTIPVDALLRLLPEILNQVKTHTVVIDTGSTKAKICEAVATHPRREQFVAAHPIAGTEHSGPQAALKGLFRGKTNIICEREKSSSKALSRALQLFRLLGMKTLFMQPKEHDRHAAYVSHLSHISSFLLGQTVLDIEKDEENIFNMAGSGFSSTVRLAKSSPQMWAPIFEQNREYLAQALLEYILHLQKFHYYLLKQDTKALVRVMKRANDIRRILDGIELKDRRKNKSAHKSSRP
ncbi:MAG: prephenate dehydrogenase [Chitinophagales bacterium]|nr:MAG: prephenate dehydrogenase [Chitinophagales bacterium]